MKGLIRHARRAVLARMKAFTGLTAIVPAADIHGQAPLSEPNWPFVKTGTPSSTPIKGACLDGAEITIPVHAFARARFDGAGAMIETAEDHAARIGAEIEKALDDKGETVPVPATAGVRLRYRLSDIQLLVDAADSSAFHYTCTVRARAIAA